MTEQYDSLNEKAKLIDIALKYTGGDLEKAKAMVNGQYNDIVVVKGKFMSTEGERSGFFFAFFNVIDEYIASVDSRIVSNNSLFEKIRLFDDWKTLYTDLKAIVNNETSVDSSDFNSNLLDAFIGYDVFPDVEEKKLDDLSRTTTEIIRKLLSMGDAVCRVELEATTSVNMELAGVQADAPGKEESKEKETRVAEVEDERITKVEEEAKYIIPAKVIVSPVKGKYINDISVGEKIKVLLSGSDPVTAKVINVLNARNENGEVIPIKGRLKAKIPMDKSGYYLYALVAKGIMAKIIEEENVKILIDSSQGNEKDGDASSENRTTILIAVLLGLMILAGIIIMNLMF